jgi:hypothetical protein
MQKNRQEFEDLEARGRNELERVVGGEGLSTTFQPLETEFALTQGDPVLSGTLDAASESISDITATQHDTAMALIQNMK